MGCATGFADNQVNTQWPGMDGQVEYFEALGKNYASNNHPLEPPFGFQLISPDPVQDRALYGTPMLEEGMPAETVDWLLEGLGTLGMLEYEDGQTKPGWTAFMNLLQSVYQTR